MEGSNCVQQMRSIHKENLDHLKTELTSTVHIYVHIYVHPSHMCCTHQWHTAWSLPAGNNEDLFSTDSSNFKLHRYLRMLTHAYLLFISCLEDICHKVLGKCTRCLSGKSELSHDHSTIRPPKSNCMVSGFAIPIFQVLNLLIFNLNVCSALSAENDLMIKRSPRTPSENSFTKCNFG